MPQWLPLVLLLPPVVLPAVNAFVPGLLKKTWPLLAVQGVAMVISGAYLGLEWAPPERDMGDVYRIIYAHVPQVWMALLAVTLNFVCSFIYLFAKRQKVDALAESAAEVGLYFGAVGVTLGAIWAKPTWGVYWTWDPRLTSAAVMLVYYAGYLAARRFIDSPEARATISSVLGVFGIVIPVTVYFSVVWMRSLHQPQSTPKTVDPMMVISLRWSSCAFLCLLVVFLYHRYRIAMARMDSELAQPDALPAAQGAA